MIKVCLEKNNEIRELIVLDNEAIAQEFIQERINSGYFGEIGTYHLTYKDVSQEYEQQQINQEALAYLTSTDWLVIRAMDESIPIPEEVKAKRQEYRNKIKR